MIDHLSPKLGMMTSVKGSELYIRLDKRLVVLT